MEQELKTIKVRDMIKMLKNVPLDADVYMSADEEGNHFSTIDTAEGNKWSGSFGFNEKDGALILYPWQEGLDYGDICPKESKEINNDLDEQVRIDHQEEIEQQNFKEGEYNA